MISQITAWLSAPFKQEQDAMHWFLFVGFIVISLYAWHMIMRDVSKVAGEL